MRGETTSGERATQAARDAAWRLVLDPFDITAHSPIALGGALNMAVDQALLESVQQGATPALRLYRWSVPCLSIGRNQRVGGRFEEALHDAGAIVRRPTGGLAVYHDRELTYAVAAPADSVGGPRAAYHAINGALVDALARVGVAAESIRAAHSPRPAASGPDAADPTCFAVPAPGEVVAGGMKLIGSAQRYERRAILQHGSLPLDCAQQHMVQRLAGGRASRVAAIALAQAAGRIVPIDEIVDAVVAGFRTALGIRIAPAVLTPAERQRASQLERDVFGAPAWTWRR